MHAGNAGAISGGCVSVHHPEKRSPCDIGHTPKMQDAFFGGCMAAHYPEKRRASALDRAGTPISTSNFRRVSTHYPQNEMHTENAGPFSGACASAHGPENEALRLWQKMQIALFSA
jgi:hypothetical protein